MFSKFFKVLKRRYTKNVFVILLVSAFVVMTLKLIPIEHGHIENVSIRPTLEEYFEFKPFAGKNIETRKKQNKTSDPIQISKLKEAAIYSSKLTTMISSKKPSTISKCGYDSCPTGKPGFINVHMVPHSHIDLGFANTYDQYYNGEGSVVGVVKVIDSIVEGLRDHPHRKWWKSQNETSRNTVKSLVENGQLEFINGGWSMNDEAVTHYVDIIDQISLGSNFKIKAGTQHLTLDFFNASFLNETFGECSRPKIGWQIDTFGHSKGHANLLAEMGFDGMFIWRLHDKELEERKISKSMEFVWSGNSNFGADRELFSGVLFASFEPPEYLCWKKDHFNETWVNAFLDYVKVHTQSYRTTDIIVPVGADFRRREDFTCFVPTDKLIEHVNRLQETGSKVNLFYSTPSCYVKAVNSHHNVTWPRKTDDMFPYATYGSYFNGTFESKQEHQEYWTGFYTSRPAFKYMIRYGSNLLQSCNQMVSYLSMKSVEYAGDISVMKHAMGVMQHHDAVTGTSKQFVIDDYIRILHRGFEESLKIQNSFYQKELPKLDSSPMIEDSYCNLNISQCDVTEKSERVIVNVYNPLASFVNKYIRVPVMNQTYRVFDPSGKTIPCDVIPIPEFVKILPGRNSSATHELVFLAFELPPLGFKSYYIKVENKLSTTEVKKEKIERLFIENERVMVQLNEKTGLIESISVDNEKLELEQEILWYPAREPQDKNAWTGVNSAIYKLRTNQTNPFPVQKEERISVSIFKGNLVQEIHQHYNGWVGQVIRLYRGQDHIELDWVVGPIDIEDNVGKEVISRVTTKLSSQKQFYTDVNGRQILKRMVGVHGNLNLTDFKISDPVGGNYYPINAQISIKDETVDKQLTMLVDRAQGGSSLNEGQLELMIHRRHVHEGDAKNEVLNETAYGVGLSVRGKHLLVLSSISKSVRLTRALSLQMYKQPQISFIPTSLSYRKWSRMYNMEMRMLNEGLPLNVNLLTLDLRPDGKYLLRLEHIYDIGEDDELSKPVMINLRKFLFNGFSITSAEETMLGGNQFKKDSKRFIWKKSNENQQHNNLLANNIVADIENVILHPLQIRTFILQLEKKL